MKNVIVSLEQQIFDWESWDPLDQGVVCFINITLNTDILAKAENVEYSLKAGFKFDSAVMDIQKSTITFYTAEGTEGIVFDMILKVA